MHYDTGNDTWRKEWNYQTKKKIRTLREKETYIFLGILEADTIKRVKTKENIKKSIPQEYKKCTQNQTI